MKKAYPLWEEKMRKAEVFNMAGYYLDKYRMYRNPRYVERFSNQCVAAWREIRPYRSKLKKVGNAPACINKLDRALLDLPKYSDAEWVTIYKFLGDAYQRLGITDIAKMDDEDAWKTAMLDGFFDVD